jgi:hypothetical protein
MAMSASRAACARLIDIGEIDRIRGLTAHDRLEAADAAMDLVVRELAAADVGPGGAPCPQVIEIGEFDPSQRRQDFRRTTPEAGRPAPHPGRRVRERSIEATPRRFGADRARSTRRSRRPSRHGTGLA